jgi:hypothetical protein
MHPTLGRVTLWQLLATWTRTTWSIRCADQQGDGEAL